MDLAGLDAAQLNLHVSETTTSQLSIEERSTPWSSTADAYEAARTEIGTTINTVRQLMSLPFLPGLRLTDSDY